MKEHGRSEAEIIDSNKFAEELAKAMGISDATYLKDAFGLVIQAARRQGIEDAAKVADEHGFYPIAEYEDGVDVSQKIAAAIRSLAKD